MSSIYANASAAVPFIVTFNRQIPTLINDRDRPVRVDPIIGKGACRQFDPVDLRPEDVKQLLFGDAAERDVFLVHGKVDQLIEVGKNTYLTELGDTGNKGELQVGVGALEDPEKRL